MKALVTGHAGYIGSVLVGVLRAQGHDVVGLDTNLYRDCDFGRHREFVPEFTLDIRDVEPQDLQRFDAVIHLADLPNDAPDVLAPDAVQSVNEIATRRLATACKQAGVRRFLFASTCQAFAGCRGAPVTERTPPAPVTTHARAKRNCEYALQELADETFSPIILRQAGVYGVSPRLRLDLFINDLVASAATTGRLHLPGDGHAFHPLIHVEDLARAYATLLTAPDERPHDRLYNLADPEASRAIDIADAIVETVPFCTRVTTPRLNNEPSIRIDASHFMRNFPNFRFRWTLAQGIRQLCEAFHGAGLTAGDWRSDRYRRILRLQSALEQGAADRNLRQIWTAVA